MKKISLPLITLLFIIACQKQIPTDKVSEELATISANKKADKIAVCHYDPVTGTSKTILINANAWPQHQSHGDLQGDCSTVLTTICNQDWMKKNLDVDHYRNGDPIQQVTDPTEWAALTTGAWCYYNNDPANNVVYGKLYNSYAVIDPRGLAPFGWHIPSDLEWTTLTNCLGGESVAGGAMKEPGTTFWLPPNTGATNSSGFTGLPGGLRFENGSFQNFFSGRGNIGIWWSSTNYAGNYNFSRFLFSDGTGAIRTNTHKLSGLSVRSLRDQ